MQSSEQQRENWNTRSPPSCLITKCSGAKMGLFNEHKKEVDCQTPKPDKSVRRDTK